MLPKDVEIAMENLMVDCEYVRNREDESKNHYVAKCYELEIESKANSEKVAMGILKIEMEHYLLGHPSVVKSICDAINS